MKYEDLTPEQRAEAEAAVKAFGETVVESLSEAFGKMVAAGKEIAAVIARVADEAREAQKVATPTEADDDSTAPVPGSTIYVVGHVGSRHAYVERLREVFPERRVVQRGPRSIDGDRYAAGDIIFIVDALARDPESTSRAHEAINRNRFASGSLTLRIHPFHVLDLRGLEVAIGELTS